KRAGARDRVGHQPYRRIDRGTDILPGVAGTLLELGKIFLELRHVAVTVEAAYDVDSFHRGPCDLDELLRVECLGADDRRRNSCRAKLRHKRRGGEEIPRDINCVRIVALHARDNGAELAILERIAVFAEDLDAEPIGRALEALERSLTIVVVHGDDGHALEAEIVTEELGGGSPLRRPEMHAAENEITAARDVGVDAVSGDERHAG